MLLFRASVANRYLGARNTSRQIPCQHSSTQEYFINYKCTFKLIGCLILVVWLLSRLAFMSSFVSLLAHAEEVQGDLLVQKVPVHTR